MAAILNVSAYKFVTLDDAPALREHIHDAARELDLKGTVLLAQEGINLFLAGAAASVRAMIVRLREDPRMTDLEAKESWSDAVPFARLKVKVKPEIIRMNMPMIRPDREARAPAVAPRTLKRWLDQGHDDAGRPVVTLDTRNDFEVGIGHFKGARHWHLGSFGDFVQALQAHRTELEGLTVVSYCTGGIRCEKAALLMRQMGMGQTYQLDGGILRYFELVGRDHWEGGCFVFDERVALDASLAPQRGITTGPSSQHERAEITACVSMS